MARLQASEEHDIWTSNILKKEKPEPVPDMVCTGKHGGLVYISFLGLHQGKFQENQDFRDQHMPLCKLCSELGLSSDDPGMR